jgi:Caspase domain
MTFHYQWRDLLACLVGLYLFGGWPVHASERIALVIGNSAYRTAPLVNPRNDATAMAALLEKAGFAVDKQLDTPLKELQSAVDRFGQAIRDPKIKFGLFYYAGHGLQQDWRNYLVPVSATIRNGAEVPQQTVDVSKLLRYMEQAQGRSFLVILDACRDDPFAGSYKPAAAGLSQFDAPGGSLLAYATAPGNVAQDGEGVNGLYTGFLLKEFAVPGARLEDAFKRVRLNVRLASRGTQIPWESTSLEEDVFIFPTKTRSLSEADRDQLLEKEIAHWMRVKGSNDPQVLADFIREFPSGNASELAQSRLNRLLAAAAERERQLALQQAQQKAQEEQRQRELAEQARQQAAQEAAARAEAARLAASLAQAALEAARKLAEAQAEAKRLAAVAAAEFVAQQARDLLLAQQQKKEAEAQVEAARQQQAREALAKEEAQRAALAKQEAERIAAARVEAERQQQAQEILAREEAQRVALAQQEAQRVAAAQAEAQRLEMARLEAMRQAEAAAKRLTEMERQWAEQEAQRPAASARPAPLVTPVAATVASLVPTPYFQGFHEHRREFSVGDEFNIKVIDAFTKASKPMVMKVTQVDSDAERVVYNGGEYVSDLMGNITTNLRGLFSTPRQFYPAELVVGKKWRTRFKQARANGTVYTFQYDVKVVGREKITVPAGTFDTFKIEARGFNMELNARLERNIWVAPGINADIAHEIFVRLKNGTIEQNDRQELVSFTQKIAGAANLAGR